MRVLRTIVGTLSLLVQSRQAKFAKRRSVRPQFISDDNRRDKALATKKFTQQSYCCCLVALALAKNFRNLALAIDRAPHVHSPSRERDHHFIKMSTRAKDARLQISKICSTLRFCSCRGLQH